MAKTICEDVAVRLSDLPGWVELPAVAAPLAWPRARHHRTRHGRACPGHPRPAICRQGEMRMPGLRLAEAASAAQAGKPWAWRNRSAMKRRNFIAALGGAA